MRRPTACTECRATKRRCIRADGQRKCNYCERKNDPCSLDRAETFRTPLEYTTPVVDDLDTTTLAIFKQHGETAIVGMVGQYLDLIHDRPHSLFHVSTLWASIRKRSIEPALLLTLCALGSRLSPDPAIRTMAEDLTARAKHVLRAHIENISIATIQACVLLANIYAAELQPHAEALYFSIANRMAQIIGLHRTDTSLSMIQREVNCRIWWTLVMADNWCSAGLGIPQQLHIENVDMALPFDEHTFQRMTDNDSGVPAAVLTEGLWAHMIRLVNMLGPIHDLNRLVASGKIETGAAEARVGRISHQLHEWTANLPPQLTQNDTNLEYHRSRGLGGPFVALHLGYHHYATLLFFRYLDLDPSRSANGLDYADHCRQHASSFSTLLRKSRELPGCEAVYATVGHMTVVSSSVLLHTLLVGNNFELKAARANLISNFAALIDLKKFWPCLESSMKRLLVFQDDCMQADTSSPHRVDQWMIKFLTEHSLPLDKRIDTPRMDQALTPSDWLDSPHAYHSPNSREKMVNQALSALWHAE